MTDMAGAGATVASRLQDAINAHDLDGMVSLFSADYDSTFPAHPDRAFTGASQVRSNWSRIFTAIPNLLASLLRTAADGDTVWTEWDWTGTRVDDAPYHMRGVVIMGVRREQIVWARLYMEPVEEGGAGNEATVQRLTETPAS